ncbi:MAG: AAA family ATPase, partial [Myxococcota bacterium]
MENTTVTPPPVARILNPKGLVPRGIDDFAKVVTQQRCFVDKSRLARDVLNCDDDIILITRPRRFGKTMNQSMLRYFFETPSEGANTKALFDGLLVEE